MARISGTLCFASRPNAAAAGEDRDRHPAGRSPPAATPQSDALDRNAARRKTAALAETERARQDMLSEGAPAHGRADGARRPPS